MSALEYILLALAMFAAYFLGDWLHNVWAIHKSIQQANALREMRKQERL